MRSKLRILHVVAPARFGGLERVVWGLARGQRDRGHAVELMTILDPDTTPHPFVQAAERAGLSATVAEIPARRYGRERAAVRHRSREFRPDVVHTHGTRVDVVDGGVARSLGIPSVTTVHGFTGGGLKNRFYERLQVRAFRRFDAVVAVARSQLSVLERGGVPMDRVHCVPNGWTPEGPRLSREDARAALGLPPQGLVIGWVGRLARVKGCDLFVEAMAHLGNLDAVACIVGDGPGRRAAEERAAELGVGDRIRWLGAVPEAGRLLAGLDVFVMSSRSEGTPIVLLEAAAAGTPIVATAVGGIPHVVSDREAILVQPEDPVALASGIRAVLSDAAAAADRAAGARARVERDFAISPWLDAYDAVYERAIARRRASSS